MQQQEVQLVIPATLAQRVIEYIRNSPSPMIPVREGMDIIQRMSNLPRAQMSPPDNFEPEGKPGGKKPTPRKSTKKTTKKVTKKR